MSWALVLWVVLAGSVRVSITTGVATLSPALLQLRGGGGDSDFEQERWRVLLDDGTEEAELETLAASALAEASHRLREATQFKDRDDKWMKVCSIWPLHVPLIFLFVNACIP